MYKLSGMESVTEDGGSFPEIQSFAIYQIADNGIRDWAVLNGMNAGRKTCFFGAPNIADNHDSIKIAEAMMAEDDRWIKIDVSIKFDTR